MDAYEAAGEEAGWKLHKNVESSIKQVLATTPHETPTSIQFTVFLKAYYKNIIFISLHCFQNLIK